MSLQHSIAVRNAQLEGLKTAFGTNPILRVYTGSPPADTSAAPTGTILATVSLPNPCLGTATNGAISKTGTWEEAAADNSGAPGYFRIWDSTLTNCLQQGTVTLAGGGGNMEVTIVGGGSTFTAGGRFTVVTYTITQGNA